MLWALVTRLVVWLVDRLAGWLRVLCGLETRMQINEAYVPMVNSNLRKFAPTRYLLHNSYVNILLPYKLIPLN